jgi:hypothetical protein
MNILNYLYVELILKPYFLFKILFGKYFGIAMIKCILDGKYGTSYYMELKTNILDAVHLLLLDDYSK